MGKLIIVYTVYNKVQKQFLPYGHHVLCLVGIFYSQIRDVSQ